MVALNLKTAVVGLIILASFALMMGTAFAANPHGDTRPGWGFGDENHDHTGPPGGPSVHPNKP